MKRKWKAYEEAGAKLLNVMLYGGSEGPPETP